MLQQTGTERVAEKYRRFLRAFPDVRSLSQASPAAVLRIWKGLGYNRRALSILKSAREIVARHGGKVPRTLRELQELPGIGAATAGAVMAFAFNIPAVFLETNIRRVFLHSFFPGAREVRDAEILPIVERTLDRRNPREWYYALMDYGAMLKSKIPNPNRRSAHYARQPVFEGSRRQIRGKILEALLGSGSLTLGGLGRAAGRETAEIKSVVEDLMKEGFLTKSGSRFSLP
jgi:A/G-specific adenine glycosylase